MSMSGVTPRNHPAQVLLRGPVDEVDDRATPPDLFRWLDDRHHFTVDVAASAANAKCPRYFTRDTDGLAQSWAGESVWCNPPFSGIKPWVQKAWAEHRTALGIVMLLPANRTEQRWWHQLVEPYRDQPGGALRCTFLAGRIRFMRPGRTRIGPGERPPFGVLLLTWTPDGEGRD